MILKYADDILKLEQTIKNPKDFLTEHIDVKDLISRAEKYISEPFPEITEEIYIEHKYKKGNFVSDKLMFKSMRMIEQTVLAECVENKGRF